VSTLRTQLQPIAQGTQRTGVEGDHPCLVPLAMLDSERALAEVNVPQSQPEEFGATQTREDQDREHGGVAEGLQHGRLLTGCLQQGLGFLGAEADGEGLRTLRHRHPHERVAFGDPGVANVPPEGAQARDATADTRGAETALAQPGDVGAHSLPVNGLHGGLAAGLGKTLHERAEVGGVGAEGLTRAVEFQVQVGHELVEDGGKFHRAHPPLRCAAHGSSEAVPVRSVRGGNGTYNSATSPCSWLQALLTPENGSVTSGEWAYKPNSVSREGMAVIHLIPPKRDRVPRGRHSCALPGGAAGRRMATLFELAPGGVCLAGPSPSRWCALTAPFHPYRGGYRPASPFKRGSRRWRSRRRRAIPPGGVFLWHFP